MTLKKRIRAWIKYMILIFKWLMGKQGNPGVVALICDEARQRFILQKKGEDHPFAQCRGMLSLFGGSMEPGERRKEALQRELEEEFPAVAKAAKAGRTIFFGTFFLPGRQYLLQYRVDVYEVTLSSEDFDRCERLASQWREVREGSAVVVGRDDLVKLLNNPKLWLASLEKAVDAWLRSN